MRNRVYTDQQVVEALVALELNGGNLKRTARELALHPNTLRDWRNAALAVEPSRPLSLSVPVPVPVKRDFAELWAKKEELVLDLIEQKAPEASFRDLSIFSGIAADKHLDYSLGRKGTAINIDNRSVTIEYTEEWRSGSSHPD